MAAAKLSGIYEIVNLVNGKRYIGSAANIPVRWGQHKARLRQGDHHSKHLQSAWLKYGPGSFRFGLLEVCERNVLIEREQEYLDQYAPAYNVALAAGYRTFLGLTHSAETIAKMSDAHRGNTRTKGKKRDRGAVEKTAAAHRGRKRSAETCARISAAMTGKKRPPRSDDYRRKLSEAMKARPANPERIAKMAATKRGSKLTPEHRARIGEGSRRAWAARKAEQA